MATALGLAFILVGCGGASPSNSSVGSARAVEPTYGITSAIHVDNGTSLAVSILINGRVIAVVPPTTYGVVVDTAQVLAPPWQVDALTAGGRVLGTLTIQVTTVEYALRLDLSCGRLDIWFGGPLGGGPSPGASPGTSGDCAP